MALSDEEQRLLEQMEAALAAEDPKLVNTLRGTGVRRIHRRRAAIAGVGFFAGLALLIAGMSTHLFLSVVGFVIMVAAAVTAIYSWQHVGSGPDAKKTSSRPRAPAVVRIRRRPRLHGQDGRALEAAPRRIRLLVTDTASSSHRLITQPGNQHRVIARTVQHPPHRLLKGRVRPEPPVGHGVSSPCRGRTRRRRSPKPAPGVR